MNDFGRCFELRVRSSTENLALIRDFVGNVARQGGLSESDLSLVELAVDEAGANVMEHAYGGDPTREVVVRVRLDADAITIEMLDTGRGFDPAAVEQKDLQKLVAEGARGGLGMRLMKRAMDEVQYRSVPGGRNELRMVKKLGKPPGPETTEEDRKSGGKGV